MTMTPMWQIQGNRLVWMWAVLVFMTLKSPTAQAYDQSLCFSCRIEINDLDEAHTLEGRWLFTRDDKPENARPETSTADWVTVPAPGPWSKAYNDKELFRVGWYRGNFVFDPSLIGRRVVFYVDAYMSKMSVYVDGRPVFERKGHDTHQRFYSIQPVPVSFEVTQREHVVTVRIDTPLMVGIYQSPFQLREYKQYDPYINFFQIFCGELRYLFAYIFAWTGLFFLFLYYKIRYPLYLVSGLTGIGIFPFYAMPNEITVKLFYPDTMLILHYPGIGFMALGYFWFSQFFYKFYPRLAVLYASIIGIFAAVFLYLAFDFHLGLFQIIRKALFLYAFAIATHGVVNCIRGYRKDPRIGPAIIGKVLFWASSGHDILLALGLIHSTSLIFVGTFAGTFAIMWITANLFAQTFNDNKKLLREVEVINNGLEKTVAERTKDLREKTQEISSILESLPQGIIEADRNLRVLGNYSQAVTHILNQQQIEGHDLIELVFKDSDLTHDALAQARAVLDMSVGESRFTFEANAGCLPMEINRKIGQENKILSIGWSSVCTDDDDVDKILVTLTDITKQKKLEKESAMLKLRAQIMEATFDGQDSRLLVLVQQSLQKMRAVWKDPQLATLDVPRVYRELHTLKGSSRLFELTDLSNLCHLAETELEHFKQQRSPEAFATLSAAMETVIQAIEGLSGLIDQFAERIRGHRDPYGIVVHPEIWSSLNRASKGNLVNSELSSLVRALRYHPALFLTIDLREQFKPIAQALGKPEPIFILGIRDQFFIDPDFSSALRNVLGHMIRNSLDHGIELATQRQKTGKALQGSISIGLAFDPEAIVFTYKDDGTGLDLRGIREKASSLGLCKADETDVSKIVSCIFISGFSTAHNVSDISGRGVGMDAVLTDIKEWKGRVTWLGHPVSLESTQTGRVPFHLEIRFPSDLGYQLDEDFKAAS
jgi:HPt (histidine-containing phosphotransfer) domain-containing protein/PAS domain-containing protein